MYLNTRKLLLVPLIAATASVAMATVLETNPMGILELEVPAQSDALISLPLHRTAAFSGQIDGVDGNTIDLVSAGTALAWSDNEWAYVSGTQPVRYYALFTTGDLEGCYYTIAGNDSDSLVLDIAEGSLDGYALEDEALQIIPYWTLSSFFGEQTSLTASSSVVGLGSRSEVHFYGNAEGVDSAASTVFYYYEGTDFGGAGWRMKGDQWTALHDDQPIAPDRAFVFRNITDESVELLLPGMVQMTQSSFIIETREVDNDVRVSTTNMVAMSLADSKLLESGGFQTTDSIIGLNGDLVLVLDNAATGFDKAALAAYYYYDGISFGGPGWRLKGGNFNTLMDEVEVFQPGQGVLIRKVGSSESSEHFWHSLPAYLSTDLD
ncbi:TIGR02597 family protein [Coraliomargarita sp. W4R72]